MNTEIEVLCDNILHVSEVREGLEEFIGELRKRACAHDRTKFQALEFDAFVSTRERFLKANYGSPEYEALSKEIKPAIKHHYKHNRHHVGYHKEGISGMNLMDVVEMIADWKAASRRSPDLSFEDSIPIAIKKYKIDDQLALVILNTLIDIGWYKTEEERE